MTTIVYPILGSRPPPPPRFLPYAAICMFTPRNIRLLLLFLGLYYWGLRWRIYLRYDLAAESRHLPVEEVGTFRIQTPTIDQWKRQEPCQILLNKKNSWFFCYSLLSDDLQKIIALIIFKNEILGKILQKIQKFFFNILCFSIAGC